MRGVGELIEKCQSLNPMGRPEMSQVRQKCGGITRDIEDVLKLAGQAECRRIEARPGRIYQQCLKLVVGKGCWEVGQSSKGAGAIKGLCHLLSREPGKCYVGDAVSLQIFNGRSDGYLGHLGGKDPPEHVGQRQREVTIATIELKQITG